MSKSRANLLACGSSNLCRQASFSLTCALPLASLFSRILNSPAIGLKLIGATSSPLKGEPLSFLPVVELGETFGPFIFFREKLGFIPNLFRAQTLLPRVIEAEAKIAESVLLRESALSRRQKECLLLAVAAANQNTYCVTAHWQMLRSLGMPERQVRQVTIDHRRAGLPEADVALLDFALRMTQHPTWVCREDVEGLRKYGLNDEPILEAVLVAALTDFLCALSAGLGVAPDFRPKRIVSARKSVRQGLNTLSASGMRSHAHDKSMPYLRAVDVGVDGFPPFAFFRERFGFVPNIFRAQTLRPDVLEAEAEAIRTVLLTDDVLSRVQKEYILLVVSAANLNTYCVAVHCEMLRGLGVSEDKSDQIAVDHHQAGLSGADCALLDFALKLNQRPAEVALGDIDGLRMHGFTDEQILESVVMTALTSYLNTLQMGLGVAPDFELRRVFGDEAWSVPQKKIQPPRHTGPQMVNLFPASASLIDISQVPRGAVAPGQDADAHLVARVREGDLNAYEELVRRHHGRIYRTLIGITGNPEDAEDGTQDTFLKVFEHIGRFRGDSTFATWLTRVAINEGLDRLRERKKLDRIDDSPQDDEEFRPRQVQAWDDNPEQLYSKTQMRALVEHALMKLPSMYRLAVMLRDIEQLSTEEAAAALGVGISNLKSRLLRGRLMLREALAPHFLRERQKRASSV